MNIFTLATRKKTKLRMALAGVSGSGKTLSALYIAYGITGDWSKIALIDTEHERARLYANRTDLNVGRFYHADLTPPYSPERYKSFVSEAANLVGADGVVIIDSFSHAWNNEGGVLELKDKIAGQTGKNSYTAWNEAGREQNKLVNSILAVDCHTIVTLRSKMDYILVENERGKMEPQKIGLAPIQRDDTEYEFDIVLNIARNHMATASKDTTFLDKYGAVITAELGRQLKTWLDEGEEPPLCAVCGKLIVPSKTKTVADIIKGTIDAMGKQACAACCKEWVKNNGTASVSERNNHPSQAGV